MVLKQALDAKLVLKKIHRCIQFEQSDWLRPFIELNVECRKKAQNASDKDFFKLMINSVYGKFIENPAKRVDVKLINAFSLPKKTYDAQTLIAKPNFHSTRIINENLVVIQLKRTSNKYDKPLYLDFCILETSKR